MFIFWKWDLDVLHFFYFIDSCNRFCLLVKVVFDGVPVLLVNLNVCLLHSAAAAATCRPSNQHNSQSSRIAHFTNLKLNIYLAGYMMYRFCTGQYSWKHDDVLTLTRRCKFKLNCIILLIYDYHFVFYSYMLYSFKVIIVAIIMLMSKHLSESCEYRIWTKV